ncbi:MAG: leucyl/phenylalanyl-tRNA--protein transferase [Verrucomicrobiota bacterium]|nr:leucyl/phenylalanyl-tRNA--protein transferase [Verrucomicrobiota bacterium]MED6298522.1 leucyl/phenylalanyl-tRNA--protein transferase [Verrucomicrobiota bacterium]MEE3176146.1 leucyl/phenylalanyl-tRNA--protein transferase [Verrucomicrobiota bacterium]
MSSINPEFLLQAYRMGIFPMAMEQGEIGWFSPDPRGIIPLDSFHVPKSLKRVMSSGRFDIRINSSFGEVIDGCAEREETWIDDTVRESYMNLNVRGYAHSVECWFEGDLVGGLYGVAIGGAFFGESMFSRKRDASKVALVSLVEHLLKRKFILLDTQWTTPHLKQFGAIDITKSDYMKSLHEAISMDVSFA